MIVELSLKIHDHAAWYNAVLLAILGITLLIGLNNVDKAIINGFNLTTQDHFGAVLLITIATLTICAFQIFQMRRTQGSL
jgi:hypothetical protein